MPKRKIVLFSISVALLAVIMIVSAAMNIQYYEKTILISLDASETQLLDSEVGLQEIRRQLSEFQADESTGQILWNGSVCMTRYNSLGGRITDYYICPYLVAEGNQIVSSEPGEWMLSLRFAMCTVRKNRLVSGTGEYALKQITLNCSTGDGVIIVDAAYNDMDVASINKAALENTFRDKEKITIDTEIFAKLTLASGALAQESTSENNSPEKASVNRSAGQTEEETKNALSANWAFQIEESGHLVNYFDGVQVVIGYELEEEEK